MSIKREPKPDAGYGGEPEEDLGPSWWRLEREKSPMYSGIQAYIIAGSESRGMVRLKNEEEFEWLSRKISGDFTPKG